MTAILRTQPSLALTFLRLSLGIVFFAHGCQKLLGLFGGAGYTATMNQFTHSMHIPTTFAFLAIAAEFFGGLGLIIGFLSRIAALGIFAEMLVAVYKVHLPNGFFMNWSGHQKGEGIEYHILVFGMTLAIMILGSGSLSLDLTLAPSGNKRRR
jgi:putative oxidoreductase